jgi:hypothetical protein
MPSGHTPFSSAPWRRPHSREASQQTSTPNRSHASSNQVSGLRTRIFEVCDQRLLSKMRQLPSKIQKNGRQRPRNVSLTIEDVARISALQRRDCLAEVVGLELRNVVAKYPFERSRRFPGIQPNSGHRDYSRLSCGVGDTQLGPGARRAIAESW